MRWHHSQSLIGLACMLAACSGQPQQPVTLDGRIVAEAEAETPARHAGHYEATTATRVQAWRVDEDGGLSAIADSSINEHLHFTLVVPPDTGLVMLSALDNDGKQVRSGLRWVQPRGGSTQRVGALDSESTLEANVFQALGGEGESGSSIDIGLLRLLIDANAAAALAASHDADAGVARLAEAVAVAQHARASVLVSLGMPADPLTVHEGDALEAADFATDTADPNADAALGQALLALAADAGVSADAAALATSAASLALRHTLFLRTQASLPATHPGHPAEVNSPLLDALSLSAGRAELPALLSAVDTLLVSSGADSAMTTAATQAGAALTASATSATAPLQLQQAFAAYHAAIVGYGSNDTSVMSLRVPAGVSAGVLQYALGDLATLNAEMTGMLAPKAALMLEVSMWGDAFAESTLRLKDGVNQMASATLPSDATLIATLIVLSLSAYR